MENLKLTDWKLADGGRPPSLLKDSTGGMKLATGITAVVATVAQLDDGDFYGVVVEGQKINGSPVPHNRALQIST